MFVINFCILYISIQILRERNLFKRPLDNRYLQTSHHSDGKLSHTRHLIDCVFNCLIIEKFTNQLFGTQPGCISNLVVSILRQPQGNPMHGLMYDTLPT